MLDYYSTQSESESDDESDLQTREPSPALRLTRVEDAMRMFSSLSVGSRRFTSVVLDKPDRHLLSYGSNMEDSKMANPRASTKMVNFIHAMSTIYGAKSSRSNESFNKWRRKLSHWIKLKNMKSRVAKRSEIKYTVDPNAFRIENRWHAQNLRQRLRNEFKTYVFRLNNKAEHAKLEKCLESLHKKGLKHWITELGHQEYERVQKLIIRGSLSTEEMTALHDQYFNDPPKPMPKKSASTEVPPEILWRHIPVTDFAPPIAYSLNPLNQNMVATLKSLAEDAPTLKQTMYAVEKNTVDSSTSKMRALLEEAFGPPSALSSHTPVSTELSGTSVSATPPSLQSPLNNSDLQVSLDPMLSDVRAKHNSLTSTKIPWIKRPKWITHAAEDTSVYETRTVKTLYDEAENLLKAHLNYGTTHG